MSQPRESQREQRFVRDVESTDTELADVRSRIADLEKALAREREARAEAIKVADEARGRHASLLRRRRNGVIELESRLASLEEECERLGRQLHLAGVQLEYAQEQVAWASRPLWHKLLRRAPQSTSSE